MFGGVLLLGQAVVARHRAAAAADLAALAAAATWAHGPQTACAAAHRVARAQDAALGTCTLRGEVAEVTAQPVTGPFAPTITARAGPPAGAVGTGGPGGEGDSGPSRKPPGIGLGSGSGLGPRDALGSGIDPGSPGPDSGAAAGSGGPATAAGSAGSAGPRTGGG
ncbi:Rv3654c family TadE-like protein [Streptomyces sp. NPDC056224]|uniref:Rv3654c family TadE-like protein n=1 Tax=Streptomyces sp. NPDC056224 TaxID=3345750 RepID=UPI0035E177C8